MERKSKRTVISIEEYQPGFDFDEAEQSPSFTFPEYQRSLVIPRITAGLMDLGIVAAVYLLFIITTFIEMPEDFSPDKRVIGIYGLGYFALVGIYFFLYMLSASQTPGMKFQNLIVVNKDEQVLDTRDSCIRGFGYLISILPVLLGFLWMLIDPEHLTWADKVSGTYIKKL
jgi:uncharacterized RDD family membrane protein YckC